MCPCPLVPVPLLLLGTLLSLRDSVHISFENGILMCTIETMNFVGLYVHISIYKCVHW